MHKRYTRVFRLRIGVLLKLSLEDSHRNFVLRAEFSIINKSQRCKLILEVISYQKNVISVSVKDIRYDEVYESMLAAKYTKYLSLKLKGDIGGTLREKEIFL